MHLSKHDDNIAPDFIFSMTWNAALINMTLQKIVQQCCKYLIIIKKNHDTAFNKVTFRYNSEQFKKKITCTIEKKRLKLST